MNSEQRRLGPYRLEQLLGQGGMGVVYRAWDERLERAVAVKQVRRGAAADLRARRRFQREARAAAQLSHPAVVHVYDVVATDDGDWIVMELVEGETLAQRLRGGPLALEETVRIARDVAEGLAAAHGKGIVHRDLKAENVMVTPSGQVKVLDFGIAKLVGEGTAEESLTDLGAVVGTVRAMSPEQAMGRTVGPPSDLFSLGTLLYEMTTGSSPFVGAVPAETLSRICNGQQLPARQLDPEVPAELSRLIDWLLAKEPAARPSSAAEVAQRLGRLLAERPSAAADDGAPEQEATWAQPRPSVAIGGDAPQHEATWAQTPPRAAASPHRLGRLRSWPWLAALALVALLAGVLALRSRVAPAPLYVAVLEPEVSAGADATGMELVPAAVRAALLRGLVALEGVAPLAPEEVDAATGGPLAVARAVAADEVVTSRLSCVAMSCDLALSRIAAGDGRVLWSDQLEVPIDELAVLARSTAARIQGGFSARHVRAGLPQPAFTSEDYADFVRLRRDYLERKQGGDLTAILRDLDALHRRAPRFFEAHALAADVYRLRFFAGRDPADLARAHEQIAAARALGPGDPEVPRLALAVALVAGEDTEAERALAELDRLAPGSSEALVQRAWLEDGRGKSEEALALLRRAARQRPSWKVLHALATVENRHGDSAAARRTLELLLERAPGHSRGMSLLAQIEVLHGDLDRGAELYAELARRSPGLGELSNLGFARLMLGRYREAVTTFEEARERFPSNPLIALNLADARVLAGYRRGGEAEYRRALELMDADPSATGWQFLSARAQAEAHLGHPREALIAMEKALALAPANSQALYDAALVYAVVGEETSALLRAGDALELGVQPRWFNLPWFDRLRARPELAAMLAPKVGPEARPAGGR